MCRVILNKSISTFMECTSIFFDIQYRFWKNGSTIHVITELSGKIIKSNEESILTGALYIDLSKVFDTIIHDLLLYKMNHFDI